MFTSLKGAFGGSHLFFFSKKKSCHRTSCNRCPQREGSSEAQLEDPRVFFFFLCFLCLYRWVLMVFSFFLVFQMMFLISVFNMVFPCVFFFWCFYSLQCFFFCVVYFPVSGCTLKPFFKIFTRGFPLSPKVVNSLTGDLNDAKLTCRFLVLFHLFFVCNVVVQWPWVKKKTLKNRRCQSMFSFTNRVLRVPFFHPPSNQSHLKKCRRRCSAEEKWMALGVRSWGNVWQLQRLWRSNGGSTSTGGFLRFCISF